VCRINGNVFFSLLSPSFLCSEIVLRNKSKEREKMRKNTEQLIRKAQKDPEMLVSPPSLFSLIIYIFSVVFSFFILLVFHVENNNTSKKETNDRRLVIRQQRQRIPSYYPKVILIIQKCNSSITIFSFYLPSLL